MLGTMSLGFLGRIYANFHRFEPVNTPYPQKTAQHGLSEKNTPHHKTPAHHPLGGVGVRKARIWHI